MSDAPRRRLAAVPAVPPDGNGRAAARRTGKPTTPAAAGGAHGPYSKPPRGPALLPAERQPMLAAALRGVRLYAYDRRTVDWLCRWLDTPTFLSLLGLLERARQAGPRPQSQAEGGRPC
jgi:hypothetical protein